MGDKSTKVDVRLPPAEKERLASMATRAGISTGELIRRLSTGANLPAYGKHEAIKNIYKVNADLARLGNLYKLSLNQLSQVLNDGKVAPNKLKKIIDEVNTSHKKIMSTLATLQEKINHL